MNKKICNVILGMLVFTLIFNNIPKPIQLNFLGGPVGSKLAVYQLIAAFAYTFYCQYKYKDVFVDIKPFLKYILVFISIMLLSTIVGLFNYPYYDLVLNGPVNQIEKLPKVLAFCHAHGVDVDSKLLMQAWIIARQLKSVLMEAFWCFGGAYIIYCLIRNEKKCALNVISKAILCSAVIIIAYSVIELGWLANSNADGKILSTINPYIHSIKDDGKWWPPLLWNAQLRSIFAEPSYYGIYMAFALPWFWYEIYNKKSKLYMAVTFILTFFLFLTKARTAFVLHLGELVIFTLCIICFTNRSKEMLKHWGKIIAVSCAAFLAGNIFINQCMVTKQSEPLSIEKSMTQYVESNVASLADPDQRSNRARYSVMEADFKIGLAHPLIGVGKGLRSSYMPDYFSEKAFQNGEVKMWLSFREKLGIMRSGFPRLGEYTTRFAESGILGLGIFLLPIVILLRKLYRKLKMSKDKMPYIAFTVSFCGILAAGIGDSLNITYCYWLLLGLGYAMCFDNTKKEKESNESA